MRGKTFSIKLAGFLVSMIALSAFVSAVKAYVDENDVWSEPNGYAHAYVKGSWTRFGLPYYKVHHEADIFECLKGRYHFKGWDKNGNVLYDIWGVMENGVMHVEYDPPFYYKVWGALTEVWAPYSVPPSRIWNMLAQL